MHQCVSPPGVGERGNVGGGCSGSPEASPCTALPGALRKGRKWGGGFLTIER